MAVIRGLESHSSRAAFDAARRAWSAQQGRNPWRPLDAALSRRGEALNPAPLQRFSLSTNCFRNFATFGATTTLQYGFELPVRAKYS